MADQYKPCGCGKIPTELLLEDAGQGGKWAFVAGNCCSEWNIEFRIDYYPLNSDAARALAAEAWSGASRSDGAIALALNWCEEAQQLREAGFESTAAAIEHCAEQLNDLNRKAT